MNAYQRAIAWIAKHEPHDTHNPLMESGEKLAPETVATYPSVALVSDVFGVNAEIVVGDVCAEHKRQSTRPLRSVADVRRGASL